MRHAVEVTQLQSIVSIADVLKETTASFRLPNHSLAVTTIDPLVAAPDSITLPAPPPLLPSLLAAGATHGVATATERTYQLYAEELKQRIRERIIMACHEIAEHSTAPSVASSNKLMKRIVSIAAEVYLRRIMHWKDYVVRSVNERSAILTKAAARNSHAFNHDFVPLLERFFEENPFPTHADKMFLAKKSNMEFRQIHVWFQNRRSRTKKEFKPLRKRPVYEGMKPSGKQYKYTEGRVTSNFHACETSKVDSLEGVNEMEIAWNDAPKITFLPSSPPHAFPSSYPPDCHYDPFPCKNGPVQFSKPEWRRVSRGKLPLPLFTSVEDLVDQFSRLNVRDEMRCKGSSTPLSHAATVAITVIPSRAPHPSVLLREYCQPARTVLHHPIVRAGASNFKVFQSSSFDSEPATLVPSSLCGRDKLPSQRKTAPLPRRLLSRTRIIPRGTTPSESSSPSSTSPCLFSPNFESRNCSFSSVSSLSTPSDTASTQEPPQSFRIRYCSPFNGPIQFHKLGEILTTTPPPVS